MRNRPWPRMVCRVRQTIVFVVCLACPRYYCVRNAGWCLQLTLKEKVEAAASAPGQRQS
jgi:hypothetical protein